MNNAGAAFHPRETPMATRSRITLNVENPVFFGTDGDDTILGTTGNDTILAFSENDFIEAGAGRDVVYAGKGDDIISGGDGDDTILAYDRDAEIVGAWGNDKVDGGSGNDTLNYKFTTSNVYLSGGADDDLVIAGAGDDRLKGDDGNDRLEGNAGADQLDGGTGNDVLYGGDLSADVLTGGKGADTFVFGMEAIHQTLPDGWTSHTYFFDRVTDFNGKDGDRVDFAIAGTASNYAERSITLSPFISAFRQLDAAANNMIDGEHQFAFITDGHDGYLFADINLDKQWDTRVTLQGMASVEDFASSFII